MNFTVLAPAVLGLALAVGSPALMAQTVSFDFSTSAQYTGNFREVALINGSRGYSTVNQNFFNSASATSTAAWVYDSVPDDTATNTFRNFDLSMDFSLATSGSSIGINFGGGARNSATWGLALFNVNAGTTTEQLRLFSGANLQGTTAGTAQHTVVPTPETGYVPGGLYRYALSVRYTTATAATVSLTITDLSGQGLTPISVSGSVTGLSSSAAEIGIRSYVNGAGTNYIDNVSITAIPEPASIAVMAAMGALGLAVLRRRRTA